MLLCIHRATSASMPQRMACTYKIACCSSVVRNHNEGFNMQRDSSYRPPLRLPMHLAMMSGLITLALLLVYSAVIVQDLYDVFWIGVFVFGCGVAYFMNRRLYRDDIFIGMRSVNGRVFQAPLDAVAGVFKGRHEHIYLVDRDGHVLWDINSANWTQDQVKSYLGKAGENEIPVNDDVRRAWRRCWRAALSCMAAGIVGMFYVARVENVAGLQEGEYLSDGASLRMWLMFLLAIPIPVGIFRYTEAHERKQSRYVRTGWWRWRLGR